MEKTLESKKEKKRERERNRVFFPIKLPKAKYDGGRRKRRYRYTIILWNKNRSVLRVSVARGQEGGGFCE